MTVIQVLVQIVENYAFDLSAAELLFECADGAEEQLVALPDVRLRPQHHIKKVKLVIFLILSNRVCLRRSILLLRVNHSNLAIIVIIIFIDDDCVEDFLIFIFNVHLPVGTSGHGRLVTRSHPPLLLLFYREVHEHGCGGCRAFL